MEPVKVEWFQDSLKFLNSRGPDSSGSLSYLGCGFGATRLSMVDPHPRSNQPLLLEKKILVFNGEIYNYSELKKSRLNHYNCMTESDTEVLLKMIDSYGPDSVNDLNGMFAFVFFDLGSRELLACRDRLGKKPLYYRDFGKSGNLFFCSLQGPLRSFSKKNFDKKALISYLHLGFVIDPFTMYEEIKSLRPYESIRLNNEKVCYQVQNRYVHKYNATTQKSLRGLISQSVMDRVGKHKRVALSLSGGMDSTIVGLVLAENNVETTAYSVYWSDSDKSRYNYDFDKAKSTADYLGISFRAIDAPTSWSVPDMLSEYLRIMEEPNNNPTGLSMIPLYKSIAEDGIRLALTGDGADEIFGGYTRYKNFVLLNSLIKLIESKLFPKKFGIKIGSRYANFKFGNWHDWARWHEVHNYSEIIENFHLEISQIEETFQDLQREFKMVQDTSSLNSLMKFMTLDQSIWLAMESNRRLDRVSMAYSVEARSPFQDDMVYEWWLRRNHLSMIAGLGKKDLLKAFPELRQLGFPKSKMGFISPLGHWIRGNLDWAQSNVDWLAETGLVAQKSKGEMSDIAYGGNFRKLQQLWTLIVLSCWLRGQDEALTLTKDVV